MHIVHAFKDYFPPTHGGIENHINEVCHNLPEFKFSVLTSSRTRRLVVDDDEGVQIIRAPELFRMASTPLTPTWPGIVGKVSPDLLHAHIPNAFGELALMSVRLDVPIIATYHADIVNRPVLRSMFDPFQRRFLARTRKILVSSEAFRDGSEALRPYLHKVEVVPFGLEAPDWETRPPEADRIAEQFPGPRIVFLGRLRHYKGVEILLQALTELEATCLVVGDGPKYDELVLLARRLGIDSKVAFIGAVPEAEKSAYYHAADVFVLPSTSGAETFGLSMMEAMACGVPAVCTEVGTGTSWLNQHNVTGLVVAPGDTSALAEALRVLIDDPVRAREMGLAAVHRVSEHFSRKTMLDSLAALYRAV